MRLNHAVELCFFLFVLVSVSHPPISASVLLLMSHSSCLCVPTRFLYLDTQLGWWYRNKRKRGMKWNPQKEEWNGCQSIRSAPHKTGESDLLDSLRSSPVIICKRGIPRRGTNLMTTIVDTIFYETTFLLIRKQFFTGKDFLAISCHCKSREAKKSERERTCCSLLVLCVTMLFFP